MYEMAKKAREAMRGKAKRLSGEKDGKVDSSDWSPAEPLNADVQTGMRPVSKRAYKKGGKVEGDCGPVRADRKPRKSGGRAITADSLINRDQKEANESREGKKHIGGLKSGGRAGKALGGSPTDALKAVRQQTMGFKKGGKLKREEGGKVPDYDTGSRTGAGAVTVDKSPAKAVPLPPRRPAEPDYDTGSRTGAGAVTRARKAGGKVNYGPMEMPAGKPGVGLSAQKKIAKHDQDLSKPKRGKAGHYADGGMPDPRLGIVDKNKMNGAFQAGSPYKKGGKIGRYAEGGETSTNPNLGPGPLQMPSDDQINKENWNQRKAIRRAMGAKNTGKDTFKKGGMSKHEDVAEDKALIKKMVKPEARTGKAAGGEKWIAGAIKHKGALHKELGVPADKKIPEKKLEKAEHSSNPKLAKRARLAETLKGLNRAKKFGGGALGLPNMADAKASGGATKGKGKTNINILINPGSKPDQMAAGMPGMPPGLPPRPTGGVPVPMGMPAAGGAPPAPMPMPMPMPMPAPAGGPPMGRKAGGKVYKSYKDMDAGAGSGLGRLEKTEIAKRKA